MLQKHLTMNALLKSVSYNSTSSIPLTHSLMQSTGKFWGNARLIAA